MQIEPVDIASEIWKNLVEYVPARDREAAAEHFVATLRRLDFSEDDIEQLAETDHYVGDVLDLETEEDDYYNDEGDNYDEPEDDRY
jgi:hypothetical protein